MPRESLHAHVGNPNNLRKLPRTEPTVRFRTELFSFADNLQHTCFVLGVGLFYGVIALTFSWAYTVGMDTLVLVILLTGMLCGMSAVLAQSVSGALGILVVGALIGFSWQPTPSNALVVSLFGLVGIAALFRLHYHQVTITGFSGLDPLNKSLRGPLGPAFLDAVIDWFTYNRHECPMPGVQRSIVGSSRSRTLITLGLIVFLSHTVPHITDALSAMKRRQATVGDVLFWVVPYFAPVPLVLTAFLVGAVSTIRRGYAVKLLEKEKGLAENWDLYLDRVTASSDESERESLYLGKIQYDQTPILTPLSVARKHIWAVGGTGSGKTTFLTSLIEQFACRGDTSIVVGDLKADSFELLATMEAARERLKLRGLNVPFWRITNRHGQSSHLFSVFHQREWQLLSVTQRTDVLMSAMSLSYSRSYGESYFSDSTYHLLHHVLRKHPDIESFRQLAEVTGYEIATAPTHELSTSVKHDGEHVRLVLDRIAAAEAFNVGEHVNEAVMKGAVDLGALFRQPCMLYGAFSSPLAPTTSPELLRILASTMFTVATMVRPRRTKVLLILDEWQRMVAGNLELMLQQARSLGVTVVLANQTIADLKQGSIDLVSTVEGNTSLQAWFKDMDQAGMQQLKCFGGTTVDTLHGVSVSSGDNGETVARTMQQVLIPRLDTNDIVAAGSDAMSYILRLGDNAGYSQFDGLPVLANYDYHITEEEHRRRQATIWPLPSADTLLVGSGKQSEPIDDCPVPRRRSPNRRGKVIEGGSIGGKHQKKPRRER